MDIKKTRRAVQLSAAKYGMTEQQFVSEVEDMIRLVTEQAKLRGDQQTLSKWREIPSSGEIPTAYELIAYLGEELRIRLYTC